MFRQILQLRRLTNKLRKMVAVASATMRSVQQPHPRLLFGSTVLPRLQPIKLYQQNYAVSTRARMCRQPLQPAASSKDTDTKQSSGTGDLTYTISNQDREFFQTNGFVALHGVMTDQEMRDEVDESYQDFLQGRVQVPGQDVCDMAATPAGRNRPREAYSFYNVMLPRLYKPSWQGNLLERRCLAIARQLLGSDDVELDFDQSGMDDKVDCDPVYAELCCMLILAKRPNSGDSEMPWHQDAAYWPALRSDTATANMWVAVSDVPPESGCMRYIPGSHLEPALRRHAAAAGTREDSHALRASVDEAEAQTRAVSVPLARGDVVVHNERVVHSSLPNASSNWRCAYVLNFKRRACIEEERALGFTHSHNDAVNWDTFLQQSTPVPAQQ